MTNEETKKKKVALIIGAGPAGLTAAYELITKTDIQPIVIEAQTQIGGLAKTIEFEGWRFDIGPHRFFSKASEVSNIWEKVLPLQGKPSAEDLELNKDLKLSPKPDAPNPDTSDKVSLSVNRLTRIYHRGRLFDYPIKLNFSNLKKMGFFQVIKIMRDYILVRIKPIKPEINLEDFFINRFGKTLYSTFFKDYTEKVWGVSCREIPKSWGAQRVKKLSISKILIEALKKIISPSRESKETSLIDKFIYPKYGAGQMYEEMAKFIQAKGGIIKTNLKVNKIFLENDKIVSLTAENILNQTTENYQADYVLSSLPLKNLVGMLDKAPEDVKQIASGLRYRDFILIVLVYKKLILKNNTKIHTKNDLVPDNWIYVQEKNTQMGRMDIFNNFSPWMLKDKNQVLIAGEYFCNEGDKLWQLSDEELIKLGKKEFADMKIAALEDWQTGFVHREKKAYPAYLGTYNNFPKLKIYLDSIVNLYSMGRNGQHRYNNMDHSMLTAIKAVENIIAQKNNKEAVWEVNTEEEYHEKK